MKKIKALWKRLFNRPRILHCTTDPGTALHVVEVDPDNNSLSQALGIPEEVNHKIQKRVHILFHETDNIVALMVILSKELKHANEFYFAAHVIANLQRSHQPPDILRALFERRNKG